MIGVANIRRNCHIGDRESPPTIARVDRTIATLPRQSVNASPSCTMLRRSALGITHISPSQYRPRSEVDRARWMILKFIVNVGFSAVLGRKARQTAYITKRQELSCASTRRTRASCPAR